MLNVSPAFQVTYSDVGVNDRLTQYKHSLYVGDKVVAIQVRTLKNGVGIPDEMRYLHHDALGNVDTLTNGSGKVIQRLAYDPFGKRSVTFGMDADQKAWTAQGFTGHEHLDGLGLIDMNARLYDPEIGRFLSADTLIPDAGLMHSYNRYIYVLNNPLKYTDPSGHNWISDRWEDFTNSMNQAAGWVRDNFTLVANIAIQALLPGAGSLAISIMRGAAAGFVGGLVSTGSVQGAVQGALWGGVGAGVAGFVGHGGAFGYAWGNASPFGNMRLLAHGVSQGLITQLRGGNFRSGMVGAVAGGLSPAGDMLAQGVGNIVSRSVVAAVFGGLAAQASGGSFADGALSAAMVHLFNDMNLFSPEENIHSSSVALGKSLHDDSIFDVFAHGDPDYIYVTSKLANGNYNYSPLNPSVLAAIISNQPDYHSGMTIKLWSCNSASTYKEFNYASTLAEEIRGSTIIAPNAFVMYPHDGSTPYLNDVNHMPSGSWLTFKNTP